MPYIPHTEQEIASMLEAIGVSKIEDLFDAVPQELLRTLEDFNIPEGLSEQETRTKISNIAKRNKMPEASFLGGGLYHHYSPAHLDNLISRSEFFTAYTPYQPEMSQGLLQAIFEYQTMITRLTAMDATNASMYDGSSATGEVCLMVNAIKRKDKILVARSVNPQYREVMQTYCDGKGLQLVEVDFDKETGKLDMNALNEAFDDEVAGVFVQSPNFFGVVEDMQAISDASHEKNALSIQVITEALSLGLLKPPGECGVDITVGEGQSFGLPVSGGGPSFGFLACKNDYIRKLPGRISGETEDLDGNKAYVLTLQAREQHIRREKASSNICTNQALCALFGLMYLVTLGKKLKDLALLNHQNCLHFQKQMTAKGLSRTFSSPFFNEFVIDMGDASKLDQLREKGIAGGINLERLYPEMKGKVLVCVTEMITQENMEKYLSLIN